MSKRVFVSADWKEPFDSHSWDKTVVDRIRKWKTDNRYGIDIICTDDVHNSVVNNTNCRRCDIKKECRDYIISSSVVIFVVGDNTATKKAGACDGISCSPAYSGLQKKTCKSLISNNFPHWKEMSYLEYEITAAVLAKKDIILVFNSAYNQESWIPTWYNNLIRDYSVKEKYRTAFWKDSNHTRDCYQEIKDFL